MLEGLDVWLAECHLDCLLLLTAVGACSLEVCCCRPFWGCAPPDPLDPGDPPPEYGLLLGLEWSPIPVCLLLDDLVHRLLLTPWVLYAIVSIPLDKRLHWKWHEHVEPALVEVEVGVAVELSAEMECCLEGLDLMPLVLVHWVCMQWTVSPSLLALGLIRLPLTHIAPDRVSPIESAVCVAAALSNSSWFSPLSSLDWITHHI